MTTRTDDPSHHRHLTVLLLACLSVWPVTSRPQALRVSSEIQALDRRWDDPAQEVTARQDEEKNMIEINKSFRQSKSLHHALLEVLQSLSEEKLRLLERGLEEDEPQADMPMEDLVDDSPQELQGEDGAEDLAGYRGELLVLDNVNSSAPNNSEPVEEQYLPQLQKINREKLKKIRLATIKNQIMNFLWPVGTPPSFSGNFSAVPPQSGRFQQQDLLRAIADKIKSHKNSFTPGDVYTEKIQSFYPSCDVPRNTDAELWGDGETMNLLFDLVYPSPMQGTQVNIVAAKLRLYKFSQGNVSTGQENYPPSESEDSPSDEGSAKQLSSFSEEKMIRVSVYWYTRSLKKHRVKRKLLDSHMLSVYGETWTEWNIRGAVKAWRYSGRNFGLAVEVEDEYGTLLPSDKYFAPMNCSQEASTSRPIPGFLVAGALASNSTNHTLGQTLRFDSLLFPMIDLCTMEFPESEKPDTIVYHKVAENGEFVGEKAVVKVPQKEQNATTVSSVSLPMSSGIDAEKHKIRHHGHKHMDENHNNPPHRHLETVRRDDGDSIEEITWADDLEGHQIRKQILVQKVIMKSQNSQQENERCTMLMSMEHSNYVMPDLLGH